MLACCSLLVSSSKFAGDGRLECRVKLHRCAVARSSVTRHRSRVDQSTWERPGWLAIPGVEARQLKSDVDVYPTAAMLARTPELHPLVPTGTRKCSALLDPGIASSAPNGASRVGRAGLDSVARRHCGGGRPVRSEPAGRLPRSSDQTASKGLLVGIYYLSSDRQRFVGCCHGAPLQLCGACATRWPHSRSARRTVREEAAGLAHCTGRDACGSGGA